MQLRIDDDLRRSRLTVFFRLRFALPHIVWLVLWTIVALLVAVVNWFATLITGRPPRALHRFLAAYTCYAIHVNAYIFLAANPFPGFTGAQAVTRGGPSRRDGICTPLRRTVGRLRLLSHRSLSHGGPAH